MIAFFRKNCDEEIKRRILDAVFNLEDYTNGEQVLLLFKIDGVAPALESDLDTLKDLLNEYAKLKTVSKSSRSVMKVN
jgi:hypothetical protein